MPRPPRLQFNGAFYHVFHRGNRRERIFWNDADYAKFEEFMIEAMNWSGVVLYDWSLMPNHFHFLIQTPDGNLAEFMQRLATRYAKYFNWVHKKVGHLFQGRYGARICDKDAYFLELLRYVELNPYRLKKGSLAQLGQWKWSSLRYYMGQEEPPEGLQRAMKEVLERFGKTLEESRKGMAQFLADGLKKGEWEDFYQPRGNRYLGEEPFIQRVKESAGELTRKDVRQLQNLSKVEDLGSKVLMIGGPGVEALAGASREKNLNLWRQALVYIGRRYYRFSVTMMGRYLGRDGTAVSQMLRRMKGNAEARPEVRRLIETLRKPALEMHED